MTAICPYCNADIEDGDSNRIDCPTCGTAHHGDCWQENGGCTVFGCASAPGDGPTLTIASGDLATAQLVVPPASVAPPPPPPPADAFAAVAGSAVQAVAPPPRASADPPIQQTFSFGGYNPPVLPTPMVAIDFGARPKNRVAYILLGTFLGFFGVHNFYAGYKARGIAQLCLTIFTLFFGAFITWIWAVVEVCVVDRDSRNIQMI